MKMKPHAAILLLLISAATFSVSASANPIISVNFTNPPKLLQETAALPRTLGGTGTYTLGTWVHSGAGEIDVNGSGVARIRNNTSQNARAISVIFSGSLFTPGIEYTVTFDVIGKDSVADSGRYWIGEVNGTGASGSVLMNVAPGSGTWATNISPYTTSGTATINFLGSANTGDLIAGENVAATSTTTFNFTYTGGDIAFAVGTYNNDFAIDNFTIAVAPIPEPSTYAMLAGLGALGLVIYRRRRRV